MLTPVWVNAHHALLVISSGARRARSLPLEPRSPTCRTLSVETSSCAPPRAALADPQEAAPEIASKRSAATLGFHRSSVIGRPRRQRSPARDHANCVTTAHPRRQHTGPRGNVSSEKPGTGRSAACRSKHAPRRDERGQAPARAGRERPGRRPDRLPELHPQAGRRGRPACRCARLPAFTRWGHLGEATRGDHLMPGGSAVRCPSCGLVLAPRTALLVPRYCPRCLARRRSAMELEPLSGLTNMFETPSARDRRSDAAACSPTAKPQSLGPQAE
jgi:hypothetical protein